MKKYNKTYFHTVYAYYEKKRYPLLKWYLKLLKRHHSNFERILDLGCAYGDFLSLCDKLKIETYGIDISDYALRKAAEHTKAKLAKCDISRESLPYREEFFDVVTCFDLVEHMEREDFYFKEINRVLKRGGTLFIITPNKEWIMKKFIPDRDPTHINLHNSKYWKRKLREVGFRNIKIKYCLVYGLPPSEKIQRVLRVAWIRPFFFPSSLLGQAIFILAMK